MEILFCDQAALVWKQIRVSVCTFYFQVYYLLEREISLKYNIIAVL